MNQSEKKARGYQELVVWQKAIQLVARVYSETAGFPSHERFGLVSQMRRAAVSIPTNIAEGQARNTAAQFINFLNIGKGSLAELETEVIVATELRYLTQQTSAELLTPCGEIGRLTNGLIRSLKI